MQLQSPLVGLGIGQRVRAWLALSCSSLGRERRDSGGTEGARDKSLGGGGGFLGMGGVQGVRGSSGEESRGLQESCIPSLRLDTSVSIYRMTCLQIELHLWRAQGLAHFFPKAGACTG